MKRIPYPTIAAIAVLALAVLTLGGCKTSGMAVTSHGQLFKINILHSDDLPNNGEDNIDVVLSNRGVKDVKDILLDVEVPSELIVLDQTNERGVTVMKDPGTNMYHFTLGNLHVGESSTIRFHVRTSFGNMQQTGDFKVTAWQKDLPGDKLTARAGIKMRP